MGFCFIRGIDIFNPFPWFYNLWLVNLVKWLGSCIQSNAHLLRIFINLSVRINPLQRVLDILTSTIEEGDTHAHSDDSTKETLWCLWIWLGPSLEDRPFCIFNVTGRAGWNLVPTLSLLHCCTFCELDSSPSLQWFLPKLRDSREEI